MSFFTAVTSFSRRSTVALSSMSFFPNSQAPLPAGKTPSAPPGSWSETESIVGKLRRFVGHQMFLQDQRNDQERRGQEGAHRPPQPGPERQRQQYGERIQLQPAPDNRRRDEMALGEGEDGEGKRRHHGAAQRGEGDDADDGEHGKHRDRTDD